MKKLTLLLFAATGLFADVKGGKIGVNFQYSGSISSLGAWYHITDMLAVNPFVGYTTGTSVTKNSSYTGLGCGATDCTLTQRNNYFVVGLEIPVYVAKFNALNLFISPSVTYSYSNGTTKGENSTTGATRENDSGTQNFWDFGLFAGLQIALVEQLHVFGKGGFDYYTYTRTPPSGSTAAYIEKSNNFGTGRFALGAIFYFN